MAQSLKSKYLLLALGAGAGLALLFGGFAYYEQRIDSADIARLTYATVEQKFEGDLEARAKSEVDVTGALLSGALAAHNSGAVAAIAGRLLEDEDIERVQVTDERGAVCGAPATRRPCPAPHSTPWWSWAASPSALRRLRNAPAHSRSG